MENPCRGEVTAVFDGQPYVLRLSLGALASLEAQTGGDLLALTTRFETGKIAAQDIIAVLGAGLRGAGMQISDEAVAQMEIEGGVTGALRVVAQLFQAAFGTLSEQKLTEDTAVFSKLGAA